MGEWHVSATTCAPSDSPLALPTFCSSSPGTDSEYSSIIKAAYEQVVHWKPPNLFYLPKGNAASQFVAGLTKLFDSYATGKGIALTSAMLFPLLFSKDHIRDLSHRITLNASSVVWLFGAPPLGIVNCSVKESLSSGTSPTLVMVLRSWIAHHASWTSFARGK